MSGPLIIRDGKLAWEVTNLFVQDASRGDGILSEYVVEFSALTSVLTSVPASLSSPNHPPSANFDKSRLSPSFDFAKVLNIRRKNRDVCVL